MHAPEDYLLDALEVVSSWDLPEEAIAAAANQQAILMSGHFNPDEDDTSPIHEGDTHHHH